MDQTNPLRYRSYYYDSETGYYHLKSRYYNPELYRFINADSVDVLDEDQNNVLENNLFAYCLNNPVNMVDDGKMSNAIRSTATLGMLTTGLLFGWQVSAAIIIAIATIVVVQILVVYAKSKRETGRPELKNKDERDLKKRNKKEQVGKKGPVKSQENNQGHTAQVKKVIERSLINNEKIMDVKQLE